MKKLFLALAFLSSLPSYAEYTAQNKNINVVIPQSAASGLTQVFLVMQEYAEKQKISLVPVFKPGAAGKIGLDYAEKNSNNADTIVLTTVSDIVHNRAQDKFVPVSNISEVKLVLVASKKSNIKHIDDVAKHPADKFNWVYSSNPQLTLIDGILDHYKLEKSKMNLLHFTPGKGGSTVASLISGDVDIGYVLPGISQQFIDNGQLTKVEVGTALQRKLESKPNAVSVFATKNSTAASNKFWQEFTTAFLNDESAKKKLDNIGVKPMPSGPNNLVQVLNSWTN